MGIIVAAAGAYLLGCVPAAAFVTRLAGPRPWGRWVALAADLLKGAAAVAFLSPLGPLGQAMTATAVLAGHQWPIVGRVSGDLGLAVAAGALTIVTPIAVPIWGVVWGVGYVATGWTSVGGMAATILLAPLVGRLAGWPLALAALPVCLMLLDRYRPALRRVLLGTEPRHLWRGEG